MSDIMRPMSFEQLLNWTLTEYKKNGTVFGEHHPYHADSKYNRTIFERPLETPAGPAAGPHTQLAQNIVAAYYTGSRFFENRVSKRMTSVITASGQQNFMFPRQWKSISRRGFCAK